MASRLFSICAATFVLWGCGDDGDPMTQDAGEIERDASSSSDAGAAGNDAGAMPLPTVCSAESRCFYVTESGAGARDGSSWQNASEGLPTDGVHEYLDLPYARLERGVTYLLADGTYPGYVLGDESGEDPITIKKATSADHGTDDGWERTMGDGEAVFESSSMVIVFSPGAKHYRIDGQFGSGKSPGGYGFRFFSTAPRSEGTYMVNIDSTGAYDDVGNVADIVFAHVEFDWDNGTPAGPCGLASAIQVHGPQPNADWTISQSYIHHASGGAAYLRSGNRFVFEGNYIYLMGDETGPGDCPAYGEHGHWETFWVTIGTGLELRGNTFENAYAPGQTGWVMLEATDVVIEDNLFFCSDMDACAVGGNGVIGAWSMSENTNVLITRNTFRDFFHGGHFLFERGTNIVIRDNVYENAPGLADTD